MNQKKITLEKVKDALEKNQYEISIPQEIESKARVSLEKMLKLSS